MIRNGFFVLPNKIPSDECWEYHKIVHAYHVCLSGTIYRFEGGNPCNYSDYESQEYPVLRDGDPSTCELMFSVSDDVFFVAFFSHTRFGANIVFIRGSHLECSPAMGMSVAIVSPNHQSYTCAGQYTGKTHFCRYLCVCINQDGCSYLTVHGKKTRFDDESKEICEIIV